jgi:cytoskeletal protein CcmA (bactofilin family)
MWKRENEVPSPTLSPASTPSAPARRETEPAPAPRSVEPSGGRALIGASTIVRGEISGEEDLLVEGRVEGKIDLRQNAVTIGAKGRVAAEVHARAILIDGEVDGDLSAEEQIVLRKSGRVRGDLCAPRVTIEDGSRFKGSVDMEPKRTAAQAAPAPAPRPSPPPSAATVKSEPHAASVASLSASSGAKS